MPDNIFHEKHKAGDNLFFGGVFLFFYFILFYFSYLFAVCLFFLFFVFFWRGDTSVFLRMKEMESVLSL